MKINSTYVAHNRSAVDIAQSGESPDSQRVIDRLEAAAPRYSSYPTADRFVAAFTATDYRLALAQRGASGVTGACAAMALYIHVPFCESVCHHCACRVIESHDPELGSAYLDALEREMVLVTDALGEPARISQLQLSGGTPTFLSDEQLSRLMGSLRRHFTVLDEADLAISIDPRTVDQPRLRHLRELGFKRLSLGVQDLDMTVLQAVNRAAPSLSLGALMDESRALGMTSIQVDLSYGLPRQTPYSLCHTLAQVMDQAPDRIALHPYLHRPDRIRPQRQIAGSDLPSHAQRRAMLGQAFEALIDRGYVHIGLNQFALPQDALAQARRQGRLYRSLQGYSTVPDADLIGLGVSAISRIGPSYSENAGTLTAYSDLLLQGELPVVKGLSLTRDDLVRRAVIMAIVSHGRVSYESIELAHLIHFSRYFANECERLQPLADEGLLTLHPDSFCLTPAGWYVAHQVAMVFDRQLQAERARAQYSRLI